MPQPKKKLGNKPGILSEMETLMGDSEGVIIAEYRGLSVPQMNELRKSLRESNTTFAVVKNTLFKRAAGDLGADAAQLDAALNGTTAAAFAKDPVATAKSLSDYITANRNTPLKIKGGVVGGRFYSAAQVDQLAKVPPRDVLLSQMLGSLQSPITGLVYTLSGVISNFVYTLQAVADKQGGGEAAA